MAEGKKYQEKMKVVGLKPTFKKYLFRDAQHKETRCQESNPTFLSVGCIKALCLLKLLMVS
jgi:hypothetical protein